MPSTGDFINTWQFLEKSYIFFQFLASKSVSFYRFSKIPHDFCNFRSDSYHVASIFRFQAQYFQVIALQIIDNNLSKAISSSNSPPSLPLIRFLISRLCPLSYISHLFCGDNIGTSLNYKVPLFAKQFSVAVYLGRIPFCERTCLCSVSFSILYQHNNVIM